MGARSLQLGFVAIVLAGVVASSTARAEAPPPGPDPKAMSPSRTVLPNGLTVLVAPSTRAPVVAMRLEYAGGAREGAPAAAALALRSVVARTAHLGDGAYYENLGRIGAVESADFVAADNTVLSVLVPREAVDTVLWMWSDQMGFAGSTMLDAHVDRQRALLSSGSQAVQGGSPRGCVRDLVRRAVYPAPGAAVPPVMADPASLAAVRGDDVRAFYRDHYAPNRATLSVVGDVDAPALVASVRRYFGEIPRGAAPLGQPPTALPHLDGVKVVDVVTSAPVTEVILAWPTAPFLKADDSELDAFAAILDGQSVAMLPWKLLNERKIAARVEAGQESRQHGSLFTIRVTAPAGADPDALVAAVDDVLRAMDEREIDRWLRRATSSLIEREILAWENATHRAYRTADYERLVHDPAHGRVVQRRLWTMTAKGVAAAVRRQLPLDRRVVMRVRHADGAPACGALDPRHATPSEPR